MAKGVPSNATPKTLPRPRRRVAVVDANATPSRVVSFEQTTINAYFPPSDSNRNLKRKTSRTSGSGAVTRSQLPKRKDKAGEPVAPSTREYSPVIATQAPRETDYCEQPSSPLTPIPSDFEDTPGPIRRRKAPAIPDLDSSSSSVRSVSPVDASPSKKLKRTVSPQPILSNASSFYDDSHWRRSESPTSSQAISSPVRPSLPGSLHFQPQSQPHSTEQSSNEPCEVIPSSYYPENPLVLALKSPTRPEKKQFPPPRLSSSSPKRPRKRSMGRVESGDNVIPSSQTQDLRYYPPRHPNSAPANQLSTDLDDGSTQIIPSSQSQSLFSPRRLPMFASPKSTTALPARRRASQDVDSDTTAVVPSSILSKTPSHSPKPIDVPPPQSSDTQGPPRTSSIGALLNQTTLYSPENESQPIPPLTPDPIRTNPFARTTSDSSDYGLGHSQQPFGKVLVEDSDSEDERMRVSGLVPRFNSSDDFEFTQSRHSQYSPPTQYTGSPQRPMSPAITPHIHRSSPPHVKDEEESLDSFAKSMPPPKAPRSHAHETQQSSIPLDDFSQRYPHLSTSHRLTDMSTHEHLNYETQMDDDDLSQGLPRTSPPSSPPSRLHIPSELRHTDYEADMDERTSRVGKVAYVESQWSTTSSDDIGGTYRSQVGRDFFGMFESMEKPA